MQGEIGLGDAAALGFVGLEMEVAQADFRVGCLLRTRPQAIVGQSGRVQYDGAADEDEQPSCVRKRAKNPALAGGVVSAVPSGSSFAGAFPVCQT